MFYDEKEIVIFDLDGVLMCTRDMCMNSYRDVLDEFYGEEFRKSRFPDSLLSTFVEIPLPEKLAENGISVEDIDKILPRYYEFNAQYSHLNKRIQLMIDEVKRLRDELGKPVYLASLKAEGPGSNILSQTGIEDYFDQIQFRTPANTKTDVLLKLIEKIGKTATIENTIYIGDMFYDREAANEIGIDYIDIEDLLGFSPNHSERSLDEAVLKLQ